MNLRKTIKSIFLKDWFVCFAILGIYFLTNRYIYGWDDQHLEIPLLKHLIDPTLFSGDYYVESLTKNFTSFFYPILAKVISVEQIPNVYLFLFAISRYFLFYWWFKLFHLWAVRSHLGTGEDKNSKLVAACAVIFAIVLGRTEEFLYRTFSHQEFTLAIVFAAVYLFYKERFVLAAFIFGIAANFHALYSLFPMMYMSFYLLFFHKHRNVEYWLKTGVTFVLGCLPFLVWTVSKTLRTKLGIDLHVFDGWVDLYVLACPQNFPFAALPLSQVLSNGSMLLEQLTPFLILLSLYFYNFFANDHFRQDRKIHAISLCAVILIGVCFYFAYGQPNRFMLDLNLIRNGQFLRFFLLGYLVISTVRMIQIKNLFWAVLAGVILVTGARQDYFGTIPLNLCIALMIILKTKSHYWKKYQAWMVIAVMFLGVITFFYWMNVDWNKASEIQWNNSVWLIMIPFVYALCVLAVGKVNRFRIVLLLLPVFLMIVHYSYYHYQYVQVTTKGGGFWQLQRNWEDMQRYVKAHTPKEAMLLIPYNMEMCGFRIQSERKVLTSYRDCGIVGFDYLAAKEWQKRIADIKEFRVFTEPQLIGPSIINALAKYQVDYIVFMRYYAPGDNPIVKEIYENEVFALYQVIKQR